MMQAAALIGAMAGAAVAAPNMSPVNMNGFDYVIANPVGDT